MTENAIPASGGGPSAVPLPDGASALLRSPSQVPERLRRPLSNARTRVSSFLPDMPDGLPEEKRNLLLGKAISAQPELMDGVNDLVILAMVSDWSFDMPVTLESLGELPALTYDALLKACESAAKGLFPSFEPTKDADSPTERS